MVCPGDRILTLIVSAKSLLLPKVMLIGPEDSVQFSHSVIFWLFATPWTAAFQASVSITNSRSLFKLMSIDSVMPFNHLILCHPLLLLPLIFPSIRVFSNESTVCIRSQSIAASASASVLSMNIQDWFPLELTDLISLQSRGLSSLLQHHSSKASVFDAQLSLWSNSYTRTPSGKTTKGG